MPTVTQAQNKQTPPRRRSVKIRPAYVLLVVLMVLFAFKFIQKTQQIKTLTAQEVALKEQNQALEHSRTAARQAITRYRSPGYVEETARDVLGLTRPGETPVQVQPTRPVVEHFRPAPVRRPAPAPATWKLWWSSFFG